MHAGRHTAATPSDTKTITGSGRRLDPSIRARLAARIEPASIRGPSLAIGATLLLAACSDNVVQTDETGVAPLPSDSYLRVAGDSRVYRIDSQRSVIIVRTGREGPAARLGHDHAIASETIDGFVELHRDPARSRADLAFAVRELVVDKPEYRDQLGLDTEPSESDIAGTYTNMLKVVPPDVHPWVKINATIAEPGALAVAVTLTGRTVNYVVPATIEYDDERATVSGATTVRHEDFGLSPFSAAGGLLRVADELGIRFDITAERVSPARASP